MTMAIIAALSLGVWALNTPAQPTSDDAQSASPQAPIAIPGHIMANMRRGDVIFRGKDHSWGNLGAQLSDRDKRFGHVGVVVRQKGQWGVIDAIGNPLDRNGSVRLRSLTEFLAPATRAGIYRPALAEPSLTRYVDEIWRHHAAQTPFDRFYDLQDASALYCSELIWLALKTATGQEQIPERTIFRNRRVIAIDDLQYAPLMTEIWSHNLNAATQS